MKKITLFVLSIFYVLTITAQNEGVINKNCKAYEKPSSSSKTLFSIAKGETVNILQDTIVGLPNTYDYKFSLIKRHDFGQGWINARHVNILEPEDVTKGRYDVLPQRIISPGDELQIFAKHQYLAIIISLSGATTEILGAIKDSDALKVIGGLAVLTGFAIYLESISHAKKAGILLNENGIGIKINL